MAEDAHTPDNPETPDTPDAYAEAGVTIAAGKQAVALMGEAVRSTYTPAVLSGIGSFGGLYSAAELLQMRDPVLVASTDGVGTKTMVAARVERWGSIGRDLVHHCVNDILVHGARPLFFQDYIAASALQPKQVASIVQGMAAACRETGCALLGGETAEMPGVYAAGQVDVVGTIVGLVERSNLIDGSRIQAGDLLLGLPSSGLHTNGYSLARKVLEHLDWHNHYATLGSTLGNTLLIPHRCYLDPVMRLLNAGVEVRGMAHITGGGLVDNLPRMLPDGLGMVLRRGSWRELPIFKLIQEEGHLSDQDMFQTFNMGLGVVLVVSPQGATRALATLSVELSVVGEVVQGQSKVLIA